MTGAAAGSPVAQLGKRKRTTQTPGPLGSNCKTQDPKTELGTTRARFSTASTSTG